MAALSAFLPEVAAACPNCPQPLAENAIRRAAFEFCNRSLWWNEKLPIVPVTAGYANYTLNPPDDNTQIIMVLHINYDARKTLYPAPDDQLVAANPTWGTAPGDPVWYIQENIGDVVLVPVPDVDATFIASVAYAPTRSATALPDKLYNLQLDTIVHGALWKLFEMPGKEWSNPEIAGYHEARFMHGTNNALIQRNRGNSRADLRVQPVAFI